MLLPVPKNRFFGIFKAKPQPIRIKFCMRVVTKKIHFPEKFGGDRPRDVAMATRNWSVFFCQAITHPFDHLAPADRHDLGVKRHGSSLWTRCMASKNRKFPTWAEPEAKNPLFWRYFGWVSAVTRTGHRGHFSAKPMVPLERWDSSEFSTLSHRSRSSYGFGAREPRKLAKLRKIFSDFYEPCSILCRKFV